MIRTLIGLAVLLGASALAADEKPVVVKFGKLSATAPATWKSEKPATRLRSHQFKVPSGVDGFADVEVSVSPDFDPKPEKNFPLWKETITPPDGKTIDDVAKVSKYEVSGYTVHVLDASGTWKYKPFPMAKKEELRPEYRVIWLIVTKDDDATHVRFSGPEAVVKKHHAAFEKWIKSAR